MTRDLERQSSLFVESFSEALDALAFAGGGKKELACIMRPDLADDPEKAHTWYLNCQNSTRQEFFHNEQVQRACRHGADIGCHVLKHWLDVDAGYVPANVGHPKSKRMALLEKDARLAQQRVAIAKQLEKLDGAEELKLAAAK